ncbi:MAG: hypothetical protein R2876_02035 [Eubacteriales bacterium]
MKKCRFFNILSVLCAVLITLGVFAGCTDGKQSEDVEPTSTEDNASDVLSDVNDMEAVLNGIVYAMRSLDSEYAPLNSEFIWNSIYIMVANYGYADANIEESEDGSGYIVGEDTVKYYATALSSEQKDLGEPPSDIGIIENTNGSYFVSGSDAGDVYIGIEGAEINDDDTVTAYVALIENESLVSEYEFVLVSNSATHVDNGPIFKYSVKSVNLADEQYAVITDIETDDDQTYVTLDYVEPVFHQANDPDDLDINGNMYKEDTVYVNNDNEETTKLLLDEDSFLVMGDIFGDTTDFENVFASIDYFKQNCTKEYKSEPLYFIVNSMGDKLLSATLWYEYYLS